jgi:hypothetical protein
MNDLPNLNLTGVCAQDLIDLLNGMKDAQKPLDRMREHAPCVADGTVDATEGLGTVIDELVKWFARQEDRVFEALLDTPEPDVVMTDRRSYAIVAHMAAGYDPLEAIAEAALRLGREDKAAWGAPRAKMSGLYERFKRERQGKSGDVIQTAAETSSAG